jgi:hypothetical protein
VARKLTPKQRVLKKYPKAYAVHYVIPRGPQAGQWWWAIEVLAHDVPLGISQSNLAAQAWADAARRLRL